MSAASDTRELNLEGDNNPNLDFRSDIILLLSNDLISLSISFKRMLMSSKFLVFSKSPS